MRRTVAGLALASGVAMASAGLAACTPGQGGPGDQPSDPAPTATPTATRSPDDRRDTRPSNCPLQGGGGGRASKVALVDAVDERPVVRLCFDVAADRSMVRGHETVTFAPDFRTCEAVFRAWPNKPETARAGNRLEIDGAAVDGRPVEHRVEQAGAPPGSPGTLVRVPLPTCLRPGTVVSIDLGFTLTLGADTPERVGYSTGDRTLWLGTAYPLLAWQRDRGWVTDPAVDLFGETAVSETYRLESLEVIAPAGEQVMGTGRKIGTSEGPRGGTELHRFRAPAVRDVSISVGDLEVVERTAGKTRIHVAGPRGITRYPLASWADQVVRAVEGLSARLGEFPYDDLWVTIAPDVPTGIEFPGSVQFGNVDPRRFPELIPHEIAHQWFYGLVGNDQGRDPWLDEAFAEYAERLYSGTEAETRRIEVPARVRNKVGESMRWYADLKSPVLYSAGVYRQGGAMLHEARRAAGAADWDRLVRAYLDDHAHRIATPEDVAEAFASEPKALAVLRKYGAID
ncbi:MAG TPA: M1 family aminopeptidase [Actinopolymorphaceae bacterium]